MFVSKSHPFVSLRSVNHHHRIEFRIFVVVVRNHIINSLVKHFISFSFPVQCVAVIHITSALAQSHNHTFTSKRRRDSLDEDENEGEEERNNVESFGVAVFVARVFRHRKVYHIEIEAQQVISMK